MLVNDGERKPFNHSERVLVVVVVVVVVVVLIAVVVVIVVVIVVVVVVVVVVLNPFLFWRCYQASLAPYLHFRPRFPDCRDSSRRHPPSATPPSSRRCDSRYYFRRLLTRRYRYCHCCSDWRRCWRNAPPPESRRFRC